MPLGTTSYAYRYQLLDRSTAPPLCSLVDQTADHGLTLLQICENARPLEIPIDDWKAVSQHASERGVELHLGAKTTDPDTFAAYHRRALAIGATYIRLVLEDDAGVPADRTTALAFFDSIMPLLESAGTKVAIENYFRIPCRELAGWCNRYPPEQVGFCIDTANSLRKFERLEEVLALLSPRAVCWHVKDWRMAGTDVGFSVEGAALGTGDLPLIPLLLHIFAQEKEPKVFLENWPPATGNRGQEIATESAMLRESIAAWNQAVAALRA